MVIKQKLSVGVIYPEFGLQQKSMMIFRFLSKILILQTKEKEGKCTLTGLALLIRKHSLSVWTE